MRYIVPVPMLYVDGSGVPLDGGTVSVYRAGTNEFYPIYQNSDSEELAVNPASLDSNGMWRAFVDSGISLDYIVKDADGNVVTSYMNVKVDAGSGTGGVTRAYVDSRDDEIRESVASLANDLNDERVRAIAAEASAKTVVKQGNGVTISEEVKEDGHSEYTVNSENLTDINIVSPDGSISVSKTRSPSTGILNFSLTSNGARDMQYLNVAYDQSGNGNETQTLDDDTEKYIPLADSELSGVVGSNGISLRDSDDDVTNAVAVVDSGKKYICTAQVKVSVIGTSNDIVNVIASIKSGYQSWLDCSFCVDASIEHETSKTLTWLVEGSATTCLKMALSGYDEETEVVVELNQLSIVEFLSRNQ